MIRRFGMLGITNCADARALRIEDGTSQRKKRKIERIMDKLLEKALNNSLKVIKDNNELFDKLYNKLLECNVIYKEEIDELVGKAA
jgi:ATP-dependent Zn protease